MHCHGGNATVPIWRVLASFDGISSWTPLKPQHCNTNPKPLANQLWCIDYLTPPTPFIVPYRLPAFLESLMPLKNWYSIHARWSKSNLKHSIRSCGIFSSLKHNFIAYPSFKVTDCIFEIHQLWQSGFSWLYSNCYCSCLFELEIMKIGQSSYKMYSNNIGNCQESMTILNACTKKKSGILLKAQGITVIAIGKLGTVSKGLVQELEDMEIRTSREHRKFSLNTEKNPGDLRRLAVTQTPVRSPPINDDAKNSQKSKIIIWNICGTWT